MSKLRVVSIMAVLTTLTLLSSISCDDSNSNEMEADNKMEAEGVIYAGGAEITNLNDFPWYGLTITLDKRYSNRYFFGDPNRPYLRRDSIVEPGAVETWSFSYDFVDVDGKRWEGIPFTRTVNRIDLEAKSQVDGPYDLSTTLTVKK